MIFSDLLAFFNSGGCQAKKVFCGVFPPRVEDMQRVGGGHQAMKVSNTKYTQ